MACLPLIRPDSAQFPTPRRLLAAEQVARVRVEATNLPGLGDLEALRDRAVGLDLRHESARGEPSKGRRVRPLPCWSRNALPPGGGARDGGGARRQSGWNGCDPDCRDCRGYPDGAKSGGLEGKKDPEVSPAGANQETEKTDHAAKEDSLLAAPAGGLGSQKVAPTCSRTITLPTVAARPGDPRKRAAKGESEDR